MYLVDFQAATLGELIGDHDARQVRALARRFGVAADAFPLTSSEY
jgi:hypothetical protein